MVSNISEYTRLRSAELVLAVNQKPGAGIRGLLARGDVTIDLASNRQSIVCAAQNQPVPLKLEIATQTVFTDLTDTAWALLAPPLPAARAGGRPRTLSMASSSPALSGVWECVSPLPNHGRMLEYGTCLQRTIYEHIRRKAGRSDCPSSSDHGWSIRTTERGGIRGLDDMNRMKGRKRHILVRAQYKV
jgi:hypothetical protein